MTRSARKDWTQELPYPGTPHARHPAQHHIVRPLEGRTDRGGLNVVGDEGGGTCRACCISPAEAVVVGYRFETGMPRRARVQARVNPMWRG
jgi:hypothetical protein